MTNPHDSHPPGAWHLSTGAQPLADGSTRFRVWAPKAERVAVRMVGKKQRNVALEHAGGGYHEGIVTSAPPGSDYVYLLDDGPPLPDPCSRHQPEGVHGPSRVVAPDGFAWHEAAWRGLPQEEWVIYELHVGTFSPQGDFAAVAERLDYLRGLGVTAVELMPVAEFPGSRNWGYDGVQLFAPHSAYGGPQGLKALVDSSHGAGLAVIMDVVYNHLGPEGNYLGAYGPYFSRRYGTPWGEALNFDGADCEPVRRFFIDNALYWLTEYHMDGLRLDAVHGIFDFGAHHLLAELTDAFHAQAARLGRQAWLIAESDLNDARVITPSAAGGWGMDGQWSDDFHHSLHTMLTDNRRGYFADFGRASHLGKALEQGYVYDGGYSAYRKRRHGNAPTGREGRQFVVFTQNHDQVANGSNGRRLSQVADAPRERLAAVMLCLAPNLPMLFMGQEYGETAPFYYFCSHGDEALVKAVREGRRAEHAMFEDGQPFLEPQAPATFEASRLDWSRLARQPHAGLLELYRALLALRREQPCLRDLNQTATRVTTSDARRWLVMEREDNGNSGAMLFCNFNAEQGEVPVHLPDHRWRLALWSGAPEFGGETGGRAPPPRLGPPDLEGEFLSLAGWEAALYFWQEQS